MHCRLKRSGRFIGIGTARLLLGVITLFTFTFSAAWAFRAPDKTVKLLPNFDIRTTTTYLEKGITSTKLQHDALKKLQDTVNNNIQVTWHKQVGVPVYLHALGNPLSEIPKAFGNTPENIARAFLSNNRDLFRLDNSTLQELVLYHQAFTNHTNPEKRSGLTQLVFKQQVKEVAVFQGELTVVLNQNNQIISISGNIYPGLYAPAAPRITPDEAVSFAISDFGFRISDLTPQSEIVLTESDAAKTTFVHTDSLPENIKVSLVIFPTVDGGQIAWQFNLPEPNGPNVYLTLVDAQDGTVLYRCNLTRYDTSGTVYEENPIAIFPPFGSSRVTKLFNGTVISPNTTASPVGWVSDTATKGNNAYAKEDHAGNNGTGAMATNSFGHFDFPISLLSHPTTYTDAAITNAFWMNNLCHDWLYDLGFDEAHGNFQANNFGRGGFGSDSVIIDVQDGSGMNNANFSTPSDGSPPRMQIYLFNYTSPYRDGDLDNGVIIHEYCHGLSDRLVGVTYLFGPQSGAMSEGWSDWYAVTLFDNAPTNVAADMVIADYVMNAPTGFRRYPYSTNMGTNPLTYNDLDGEVHDDGEIWCVTLWEMYKQLVQVYGLDTDTTQPWRVEPPYDGRERSWLLVTDAMIIGPHHSGPTMLEMRNAILSADSVLFGGADKVLIWQAFAKRGMGYSAISLSDSIIVTEAFDLPPFGKPSLVYVTHQSLDSTGNNNGQPDPGETIMMPVLLKNFGDVTASNISAILTSTNGYITISNNSATFPTIYSGDTQWSNSPHFTWYSSSTTPQSTIVDFNLILTATYSGSSIWQGTTSFRVIIGGYSICTPVFNWIDATGGTEFTLGDEGYVGIDFGFNFPFYGTTYSRITITSNGYLTFGSNGLAYTNNPIPSPSIPNALICPFWDDLNPSVGGLIYYLVQGSAPNRTLTVEWYQVPHYEDYGAATFEVTLYETTGNIVCQYQNVVFGDVAFDYGASATVGIENQDGTVGLQYSYNSPALSNNMAIGFCLEPIVQPGQPDINIQPSSLTMTVNPSGIQYTIMTVANAADTISSLNWNITESLTSSEFKPTTFASDFDWLAETPTSGSNLNGTYTLVTVTFDATDLSAGIDTTAYLNISSNDPVQNPVWVPVTLHVVVAADTTPPTGSIVINSGAAYTNSTVSNLVLNATDALSGVTTMRFSTDSISWSSWEPYKTARGKYLTPGAGTKYVYVQYQDRAGNQSIPCFDTIVLETTAPTGSVIINSGATYTNSTVSKLTLSATDALSGVTTMRFSTDSIGWSGWEPYKTARGKYLTPGAGTKYVYVQYQDRVGNISIPYFDTIVLETTAPTGSIVINNGAAYTNSTVSNLTLSVTDALSGVTTMRFNNDSSSSWSIWEPYKTWRGKYLTYGDGTKSVKVQYQDKAGNVSSIYSDTIILDMTPPTGSIIINNGDTYTTSTIVTLALSATDTWSGISTMRFSNDIGTTWSIWEPFKTSRSKYLIPSTGVRTVTVQYRDVVGNQSVAYTDDIILQNPGLQSAVGRERQ